MSWWIREIQVELALSNFVKIKVWTKTCLSVLVNDKNLAKDLRFKFFVPNCLCGNCKSVAKQCFCILGALNGNLDSINTTSGYCDANNMLEVAFWIALLKLLVDDVFHARVNLDCLIIMVNNGDAFLNIKVNTFMHKSLSIHIICLNVKAITCFKC